MAQGSAATGRQRRRRSLPALVVTGFRPVPESATYLDVVKAAS